MENNDVISFEDFALLMLATLAKNSKNTYCGGDIFIVSLPMQYKQIIQNILCADNGWKEEFSVLIDVNTYFDDHFAWERHLLIEISKVLSKLGKKVEFDLTDDKLLISLKKDEVDQILDRYQNNDVKDKMEHFTNLLVDYIYTRDYQEKFHDYYAVTVKKMQDMNKNQFYDISLDAKKTISRKRFNIFNK